MLLHREYGRKLRWVIQKNLNCWKKAWRKLGPDFSHVGTIVKPRLAFKAITSARTILTMGSSMVTLSTKLFRTLPLALERISPVLRRQWNPRRISRQPSCPRRNFMLLPDWIQLPRFWQAPACHWKIAVNTTKKSLVSQSLNTSSISESIIEPTAEKIRHLSVVCDAHVSGNYALSGTCSSTTCLHTNKEARHGY